MPRGWCICSGCSACPPDRRSHTYDVDAVPGKRCGPCQAVEQAKRDRRGNTTSRGYGSAHQRKRKQLVAAFEPGQPCARCGEPIWRAEDADLGHTDDRSGYRGLEHAAECNRSAGAKSRRTTARPPMPTPAEADDSDDGDWIGIA